ncbi:SufS family cysteine desulfurase [Aliiglaciecola litoralis]|uniref:cysteine desulfurase n=1 Tax=Aliiglaciecola litoralis TaxID=582857 RepID=A0ABN1LLK3_9ALTE
MKDRSLRAHFPFFSHPQNQQLLYFDNAATTQKPDIVISTITDYYSIHNVNVHRASYQLAANTTSKFEQSRVFVQEFIHARYASEIIFTKGATESINLIAIALAETNLPEGGRILVSATEHHANLVPWQQLAKKKGLHIDVIPIDSNGCWQVEQGLSLISDKTCIVALGMVSNALGSVNKVGVFIEKAKQFNSITVLDAAQAVSHLELNVQSLDCDFLVFSGHKAYGPTGIGVLYGKQARLNALPVFLTGGEMIEKVDYQTSSFQPPPFKFEAGTPHVEGVLGLHQALQFIQTHRVEIKKNESALVDYLRQTLEQVDGVRLFGDADNSIATCSFIVEGCDSQDLGTLLNEQGIAVRVGHHCAMPLMNTLNVPGTLRISLACYNTVQEIDKFALALHQAIAKLNNVNLMTSDSGTQSDDVLTRDLPLAESIKRVKGWDSVYRQVMLAGKGNQGMPAEYKTANNEVLGCESQVWLICHQDDKSRIRFEADASGKIVRGLLAILLEPVQTKSAEFILQFDFFAHLQELGLDKHISASRGNGLAAVVRKIKKLLSDQK